MNAIDIIDSINRPNAAPGDYTGADGLLYCGKCHTPKQTRGEGIAEGRLLSISCACRRAEIDEEERKAQRRRADELRGLCLPERAMHGSTFASAADAKHIRSARRYAAKWDECRAKNIGLLFWGNTGTGKSFTAQCIANALLDRQIPVKYYTAVQLVARLMEKENREPFLASLRGTPLLIIDDVGAERDTPFSREQLCAVIDERSEARRPLIVTTNYTLDEMRSCQDHAQQRLFDRITALCVPVAVIGESRRREIGEGKLREAKALLEL